MIRRLLRGTPVNVLVDRSKDAFAGHGFHRAATSPVFQVSDNRRRLSRGLLSHCDVLTVCGNSTIPYSKSELAAIRAFVRGGGGLVLAACSGSYELETDRPITALSGNAVARLFGFEFLSAATLPANALALRGYDRQQLSLTPAGRKLGMGLGDIPFGRPGPLAVPAEARVLLRENATGQAVAAVRPFGKGRVLTCNDLALWTHWSPWATLHWLLAVVPRRRRRGSLPATVVETPRAILRRDGIEISGVPGTGAHAARVLDLARNVRDHFKRTAPRSVRKIKLWRIVLDRGCGCAMEGGWGQTDELWNRVGVCLSDAAMATALAGTLAGRWVQLATGSVPRQFVGGAASEFLQIEAAAALGFGEYAARWRQARAGGKREDLGRLYFFGHEELPQVRGLWCDIADEFGPDAFAKFARAVPKGDPFADIPREIYSDFSLFAWLLARALGVKTYEWLERHGHALRRIPLDKPGSKEFKHAVQRAVEGVLTEPGEKASDRFDAAAALVRRLTGSEADFRRCVRRSSAPRLAQAFPAAARLVLAKDARGPEAMQRFLRSPDHGLASVAALMLVFEAQDHAAADVLVRLANQQDIRFRLAAGHALKLAGDPRADRFAAGTAPGSGTKVDRDGMVKVYAVVGGDGVANVFSLPMFWPGPYGVAHSTYFVAWVHTAPRWRRRGMARLAIVANLRNPWAHRCALVALNTGTRNVAHALYRDCGLIDRRIHYSFRKSLRPEVAARPPRNVRLRCAAAKDLTAALAFVNEQMSARPCERVRPEPWHDHALTWLAFQKRRLVGVVSAAPSGKAAILRHLAVAEIENRKGKKDEGRREKLGLALLSALHRGLRRRKFDDVDCPGWFMMGDDFSHWLLRRAGYGSRRTGGMEMFRINDLVQYLDELAPALERRLKDSKTWATWTGAIWIDGGRLKACLNVDRGRVTATRTRPRRASMVIRSGEIPVQRLAMGVTTPFEEYLQIVVETSPLLNDNARDLLECLFPKAIREP